MNDGRVSCLLLTEDMLEMGDGNWWHAAVRLECKCLSIVSEY